MTIASNDGLVTSAGSSVATSSPHLSLISFAASPGQLAQESKTPRVPTPPDRSYLSRISPSSSITPNPYSIRKERMHGRYTLWWWSSVRCLYITSRISTFPPDCEWLDVPTLSLGAACDAFYHIYIHGERSELVNNILEQLDFHPLSITPLATVAHHNKWDTNRLVGEWSERRTYVLQTEHNKSLTATIEPSLSSPMFGGLGPNVHGLLEAIALFLQGTDEKNLVQLFSTITDRKNTFEKPCVLSCVAATPDAVNVGVVLLWGATEA